MSTSTLIPQLNCTRCHSRFVKRSRRAGLVDQLISVFSVYPFRCQLCGHRFYHTQKGLTFKRVDNDRREYERLPVNLNATFTIGTFRGPGVVTDLSMGGCSFVTESRLEIGSVLRIAVQLPDPLKPVDVDVAIVRSVRANRVGIQFVQIESDHLDRLQHFIRELISNTP